MPNKVLIANRGEIAVRIARTCHRLGIATATVHSSADRFSRHVREIGESVELGPPPAGESYLDIDAMVRAAVQVGADAVHPGYGFLAENAEAALAVERAGLTWIGPTPDTIDAFGDKAKAKVLAVAAGVPVIPGVEGTFTDHAEIAEAARQIGAPVLLKAAAGGGGRGMRLVESFDDLDHTIDAAMSEAERSFGSPELMVERYLVDARHIEVQIAGDGNGNVIHLFERECSLQRRHQKIIEEAPSPSLSDEMRERILEAACSLGRHVSYRSIGTVELIATGDEFYFLEVNPRIQVEHPVTEEITGIDVVELQLRVADGHGLGLEQHEVTRRGHAFEARVYAEDPDQDFLPAVGTIAGLELPDATGDDGLRVECSVDSGDAVSSHYDPMIVKLVTWAHDRDQALQAMRTALAASHVDGLTTNLGFLRNLMADPAVASGQFHTRFVEESDFGSPGDPNPEEAAIAAALWLSDQRASGAVGPWTRWGVTAGWRLSTGEEEPTNAPVAVLSRGDSTHELRTFPPAPDGSIRLAIDNTRFEVTLRDRDDNTCVAAVGNRSLAVQHRVDAAGSFIAGPGFETRVEITPFLTTVSAAASGSSRNLTAPMTGLVLRIPVKTGDSVDEGDVIVVMESMKLELPITAQHPGTVAAIHCSPGAIVDRGVVVAEIDPMGATGE